MIYTKKALSLAIISFLIVVGFSVPATTYASSGNSFFLPAQNSYAYSQPREQLVVYAFGPTQYPQYQQAYYTYQPGYQYGGQTYPAQVSYPSQYQNQFARLNGKFNNYTYIAPQTMQNASTPSYANYSYPQYQPYNSYPQNYGYAQPQYSSYSYPSYGYGGYPQPTGETDLLGHQLCNWASDYQGYPCDQDPHQWIHDPYTDTWY